jgi:hypothetical protein
MKMEIVIVRFGSLVTINTPVGSTIQPIRLLCASGFLIPRYVNQDCAFTVVSL